MPGISTKTLGSVHICGALPSPTSPHPAPAATWPWPQRLTHHWASTFPFSGSSVSHLNLSGRPNFFSIRDWVNASLSSNFFLELIFPLKSSELAAGSDKKLTECLAQTLYSTPSSLLHQCARTRPLTLCSWWPLSLTHHFPTLSLQGPQSHSPLGPVSYFFSNKWFPSSSVHFLPSP